MKSQKGVSLVGLSLIIIVLLILAGVAIYMVIGPDGVLKTNKNEVPATNTSENSIVNNNTNNNTTTNTNEIENQNTTTGE